MSVQRTKKMPSERTLLGVMDAEARATVKRAQGAVAPIVASEVPKGSTGKLAKALRPRVTRTSTGAALLIAPSRKARHDRYSTIAQVARWVSRGTGLEREGDGAKNWIHAKQWQFGKRMTLPGGKRRFRVRGQRANPFMDRIFQRANPVVERTYAEGARTAAREASRTIGRGG